MAAPTSPGLRPAALLLTGGASRRMGRDKAAIEIDGTGLAERTAALLREVAAPVVEVGPGYTSLPHLIEDPPGSGPLAAIAAGAEALHQSHYRGPVLVVATDLPCMTAAYLQLLAEHPAATPDHSVVPRDPSGQPQPLCARYSPAALTRAAALVANSHRSMKDLLGAIHVTWLDHGNEELRDIDTPDDLAALR